MPTPDQAKALWDLGAGVILVLLVSGIFVGLFRKWWVPGWLYDRLYEDWRTLKDQTDRNAKVLEAMAERDRDDAASGRGK